MQLPLDDKPVFRRLATIEGVERGPNPPVGIDFGTTNSSIALATAGQVQLVSFPAGAHTSTSSRSLLYLQRRLDLPGKPVSTWTGAPAVQQYLAADAFDESRQGRLIQSLKSHLAARDLLGTEIFGRQYPFVDLVARLLRDLRQRASEAFGFDVTHALVGRPVEFVGASTEADNEFALDRLRQACALAGFTDVEFAMEPVAAAFAYRAGNDRPETLLVGDFGGGTTDFSLLRLGPATPATNGGHGPGTSGGQVPGTTESQVLGTTGVGLAGDAFDARIVRRLISPALGSDSMARSLGKVLPALPAWVYSNLERWHTLSFLRTHAVRDMLRAAEMRALEPQKIAALRTVVDHDLGYRLHGAVQRLKIELSSREQAEFSLDAEAVHLHVPVERQEFESWIAPELARIERSLDTLLQQTGVPATGVDRVFLTGGTSLVPAVRRVFTQRFGESAVRGGEAFTSVAQGLALMAESQQP